MRVTSSAALLALLGALSASAAGGEGSSTMVGQSAPEIRAASWLNGDGRTKISEFRGEAVLLEFWTTHCPMCRGQVGHMNKLREQYADKGLFVIGITGDDQATVQRWVAHAADVAPEYAVAIGGGSEYSVTTMPHAFLVGPDGLIAWEGNPGSLPEKDVLAPMLKSIKPATKEAAEARAAALLAYAESFAADRQFARAEFEMSQVVRLHPNTEAAKKAAARMREIVGGENAAEYEAQKQIAKLVGGFEHPSDRLKAKDAESLGKRLAKMSEDLRAKTPRAAQIAADWAAILSQPWK